MVHRRGAHRNSALTLALSAASVCSHLFGAPANHGLDLVTDGFIVPFDASLLCAFQPKVVGGFRLRDLLSKSIGLVDKALFIGMS
jgi:hypothetical protein